MHLSKTGYRLYITDSNKDDFRILFFKNNNSEILGDESQSMHCLILCITDITLPPNDNTGIVSIKYSM